MEHHEVVFNHISPFWKGAMDTVSLRNSTAGFYLNFYKYI